MIQTDFNDLKETISQRHTYINRVICKTEFEILKIIIQNRVL